MKIISWNVNGVRAVSKKWFRDFVLEENPDILCIQETKAFEEQFLKDVWELDWYKYVWHKWERAGYAGSAIFYKEGLDIVDTKNHFDEIEHFHSDGRVTEIEFKYEKCRDTIDRVSEEKDKINCDNKDTINRVSTKNIVLLNWYFPNGGTRANGQEMLSYKLEFYDRLIDYANKILESWRDVIMTWDFNICHTEIDIARPEANKNSIWFLPVERKKFSELLDNWYIDTFRRFYPDKTNVYSWWSYRAWARSRNIGWRLDYFVVNNGFIDKVKDMQYLTDVMGSDHCPIKLILK